MKQIIKFQDSLYPKKLHDLDKPPERLYVKGSLTSETFSKCVAIVGSRDISTYGKSVVRAVVASLVHAGYTVVSGFMYGVDIEAHKAALEFGGKTIAVMPCGIDSICPRSHEAIYNKLLEGPHTVLSEYAGTTPPQKYTFVQRNRIVVALSMALVVIEAGMKSGSLVSAGYAKKYNRPIFALPGTIYARNSKGTNMLIKSGDASAILSPHDVVKALSNSLDTSASSAVDNNSLSSSFEQNSIGIEASSNNNSNLSLGENTPIFNSEMEKKVYDSLSSASLTYDELLIETNLGRSEIVSTLLDLEMRGLISFSSGYYYVS